MRRPFVCTCVLIGTLAVSATSASAAVGCSLNDPDRDIQRIFPEATGYSTEFITIKERGGDKLREEVEARLGDALDPLYEATDVPYAYYTVLKGKETVGHVHGVNQKGKYGGMQLILATDPHGMIVSFHYQKISSPEAKRFRDESFTNRFRGLTLADFYTYGSGSEEERAKSPLGDIENPSETSGEDFAATLRGIMKNLILLDEFMLGNRYYNLTKEGESNEMAGD